MKTTCRKLNLFRGLLMTTWWFFLSSQFPQHFVKAFSNVLSIQSKTKRHPTIVASKSSLYTQRRRLCQLASVALVAAEHGTINRVGSGNSPSLRSRVRDFLSIRRQRRRRNDQVLEVDDVEVLRYLLGRERASYTALMFHAKFCSACQASLPLFQKLAQKFRKSKAPVTFLSVTVTKENSQMLQEVFGITKFPLAQIYHPDHGLVDERPVLRKAFKHFEDKLRSIAIVNDNTTDK